MSVGKTNFIVLDIKFSEIKNFLEHADKEAGAEILEVFEKNDAGEYEEEEDGFENALFYPVTRQEIASRAVYYELNAMVESELYARAYVPWLESQKHRGPKTLDFNNLTLESVRSLKMVQDLRYPDVIKLIEDKYKIRIKDLEGAEEFLQVREMVNSFKHRQGMIDFRRQEPTKIKLIDYHKAEIEQAYQAITKLRTFITALWKATEQEPSPSASSLSEDIQDRSSA